MGKCIIISCAVSFFGKNSDIFMATVCDMALGRLADRRYFLGIVHDWIKTGFMRKKGASSYIQMVFIVCCLQLTAPNKGKTISVLHVTNAAMVSSEVVSRYCVLFTMETKKKLSFFHHFIFNACLMTKE